MSCWCNRDGRKICIFYSDLKNVSSPGMITVILTLPSAPKVGGPDGSWGDTVEVIPIK